MPVVRPADLAWSELPGRLAADPLAAPPMAGVDTGTTVRVVRVGPGPRTPHLHPHSAEILYVLTGSGEAATARLEARTHAALGVLRR